MNNDEESLIGFPQSPTVKKYRNQSFTKDLLKTSPLVAFRYIFSTKLNYILLTLTFISFILSEVLRTAYFRLMANYDNEVNPEKPSIFSDGEQYWYFLCFVILGFLITQFVKY